MVNRSALLPQVNDDDNQSPGRLGIHGKIVRGNLGVTPTDPQFLGIMAARKPLDVRQACLPLETISRAEHVRIIAFS